MPLSPAQLNNWPKFLIMLVALVGMNTAWLIGRAAWSDIEQIVTALVFYGIGNGVAAVRQQPQQPIFSPTRRHSDRNPPNPS